MIYFHANQVMPRRMSENMLANKNIKKRKDDAMKNMSSPADREEITNGQINKLGELIKSSLRKSGFKKTPLQQVIKKRGKILVQDLLAVISRHVEEVSKLISRIVKVKRERSPQQVIDATGRKQYIDKEVVASMPKGEGKKVEVTFFQVGSFISPDDLAKKFDEHGLKPDPYAQSAVNEADPSFADTHPNGTQWQDANGKWCYIAFARWHGERYVHVNRDGSVWGDYWWFGGVRK